MTPQRPSTIPAPASEKPAQYPRFLYHPDLPERVIRGAEEEKALKSEGWGRTPHPAKVIPAPVDPIEDLATRVQLLEDQVAEMRKGGKHGK